MTRLQLPWRGRDGGYSVLVPLVVAVVAFAYQQTAVVPVIPVVEKDLGIAVPWGAWLLSGYLLVATVAGPVLGRLGDRWGRRAVLLAALGVFLLGSVGAACAPTGAVLIGFRALQGLGGAVYPLSLSIAREELPSERVAAATSVLTAGFGLGTALGFALSGLLTEAFSWRAVFVLGAVVVALAVPPVLRGVPGRPGPSPGPLDAGGAAGLGTALALLLVALTLAPRQHGAGWLIPAGLLAAAGGAGAWWVRHEDAAPSPLVDARTLRSPTELWTNAATLCTGFALFGAYYLLPRFVQEGHDGLSSRTTVIGLCLLPTAIGQLLTAPALKRVQANGTPRRPLAIGLAAMAAGAAGFAASVSGSVTVLLASGFVLGCGVGLAVGASGALASLGADQEHAAVATSFNSTVRRVGGGIGSQVGAAVLVLVGGGSGGWLLSFGLVGVLSAAGAVVAVRLPLGAVDGRDGSGPDTAAAGTGAGGRGERSR
ncbi:MFS transporter [Streptomyces sediminimaris]|uniref:MFS transporter n=1 Tax=Streptomyces sediminimaris TaxID=3383721 RepID=UPI00399A6708